MEYRRLTPGEYAHHAGRQGAERRIPLPGEFSPLAPCDEVMPGDTGYPAEIEITLPETMLAIPFGSSEAEVVAEHEDGTRTWRYEHNGAGGILYAGDYIREDIEGRRHDH